MKPHKPYSAQMKLEASLDAMELDCLSKTLGRLFTSIAKAKSNTAKTRLLRVCIYTSKQIQKRYGGNHSVMFL